MGMGLSGQSGNYHLIGVMQTKAAKAIEINEAMKQLLHNTGFFEEIMTMSVALVSDRCAAQMLANSYFMDEMKNETNAEINHISCYMHTSSNCQKNIL